MTAYILDAGPLGRVCHPRHFQAAKDWLAGEMRAGTPVYLPEIADYEVRRELIRLGSTASLRRLGELARVLRYVPLDTATLHEAAQLWAKLWGAGQPIGSPDGLGADAILAAQALRVGATVVTTNAKHLMRMVDVVAWPA